MRNDGGKGTPDLVTGHGKHRESLWVLRTVVRR